MNAEEIFHQAIEITDPAQRAAYLDRACRGDQGLRAEVEALLNAHERAGDFLEAPPAAGVTLNNPTQIDGPGTAIGRYELLELIGEGGMGLVYLAEQKEPVKRRVALKIIKPGMDSKQVIARFEAERQALAVLDHPNIAHVFDAGGTETGRPYFVMEHVKGMSITRYCDDKKLTIEQRLRLFEQVCEGVQHAHQKGIIHRDLKPSNILVTMQGDRPVPKIIDFGIAKATTQSLTDVTVFTYQGQLLGTPEYMSPEQVDLATQDIDTRSDIYSLGVVLYELLAGVLPFESESFTKIGLAEIQRTIREDEPASPSLRLTQMGDKAKGIAESRGTHVVPLARRLHRELEWIPLKAMRKDRCRRYRSASEMADDVRNYLNGLPLLAGPETAIYRVQKFVRKHAGSVATVALLAVAIVLGFVVSTAMYFKAEDARQKETTARTRAEQSEMVAQEQRKKTDEQRKLAEQRAEDYRRSLYGNSIALADASYREGNMARVRELLQACPNDLHAWEWDRLNYIRDQSSMTVRDGTDFFCTAAVGPGGKYVVSGSKSGSVKLWDLTTGAIAGALPGHRGAVWSVAFSPDGRQVVSTGEDRIVKVWDVKTRAELMTFPVNTEGPVYVSFSPDGKLVGAGAYDGIIQIRNVQTGDAVITLRPAGPGVGGIAFSPDGKHLASAETREAKVTIWDLNTGAAVMSLSRADKGWTGCVAYSPDGNRIASCGGWDRKITIWDASTGAEVLAMTSSQREALHSIAFSPDGRRIVSAGRDPVVKVWDALTGDEIATLRGHEDDAQWAVFGADADIVISGSRFDGSIRVWNTTPNRERVALRGHRDEIGKVALSRDGRTLASSGSNVIKLWDVGTGTEVMTLRGHEKWVEDLAFSPDGERLVSAGGDKTIRVWDTSDGREVLSFRAHEDVVHAMALSPDGDLIASGGGVKDRTVKLWNAHTGDEVAVLRGHTGSIMSIAFSPDGKRIVSGGCSDDDTTDPVRLWDIERHNEIMRFNHPIGVFSVAFAPDGRRVASGGCDGDHTIRVWDADTGAEVLALNGHDRGIGSVAFSPDGKRIISGSKDNTLKVWDVTTGAQLMTFRSQSGIWSAVFSSDGRTIAIPDWDTVALFESAPPAAGYQPRINGDIATRTLEAIHEKHGSYHEVIGSLQAGAVFAEPVRRLALRIATSRKWEDADKLKNEAWEVLKSSEKDASAYRGALQKAEKANGWEPNDPVILRTLGTAQYRTGSYEEALKTLMRAEKLRAGDREELGPSDLAFTAMCQHQLGRVDEAKASLEQLRALLKDERFADDQEAKAMLTEAEGLIEGQKP